MYLSIGLYILVLYLSNLTYLVSICKSELDPLFFYICDHQTGIHHFVCVFSVYLFNSKFFLL